MKRSKISRRSFLLGLGAASAAAVLTACGGSSSASTATAASGSAASGSSVVYRTLDQIKESGTINIGVFSDKNRSATWMRTASIRAMMSTLPAVWARIWA